MVFAAFALTLALLLLSPAGSQAKDTGTVALEVHGQRLTLRADDAPLAAILQQLANAARLTVHCREPVEERVSVDLSEVSFEEGVQRLLQHRNTLLVYDRRSQRLSTVYVFGLRDSTAAGMNLPSATAPAGEEGEIDFQAEMLKTAREIETFEQTLRDVAIVEPQEGSHLLQSFLANPDPSVRITALQWLVGKQGVDIDALALAVEDNDYTVQSVAAQMLLDYGVGDQDVQEIMAAAEEGDAVTVRQKLGVLLAR